MKAKMVALIKNILQVTITRLVDFFFLKMGQFYDVLKEAVGFI